MKIYVDANGWWVGYYRGAAPSLCLLVADRCCQMAKAAAGLVPRGAFMNSDEYHAVDLDEDSSNYMACRYCGLPFGDHEQACPCSEPTDYDDPDLRGREEDKVFGRG